MTTIKKSTLLDQLGRIQPMDSNGKAKALEVNTELLDTVMCSTYSSPINTTSGSSVVDIPITQPANTVLEDLVIMCTGASSHASACLSFTAGTAAHDGEQIVGFTSKSLTDLGTSTAVGQGASIHTKVTTALQGGVSHTIVAGAGYTATDRTIFTRVSASANGANGFGAFSTNTGQFKVIAKYYNL